MQTVQCCCCKQVRLLDEVEALWYPTVYHEGEVLGDLCDECVEVVGLRDAEAGELPHNDRVADWEAFCRRREQFAKGK